MAYSDLNYVAPKIVKHVFGLSEGTYTMLAINGSFKFLRKYKNPLITMDSLASIYEQRSNVVLKRWGYDYESPREKYAKMLDTQLKGFPRCFFRVNDVPDGYNRAFHQSRALRLCIYVFDGFARVICFSRENEADLETLYFAFEEGKVDIEA